MRIFRHRAVRPRLRSHDSGVRYILEELKFVNSFRDLEILFQKVASLMPRMIGNIDRVSKAPPSLQIEPTNHCNVECVCCPASRSSRPRGRMDIDLFFQIIDDASQMGVKNVRLFLHGEPLIHPQIVEMIRHIKARGLSVYLTTNGMLFSKNKIEDVLSADLTRSDHITFSLLGASKQVHESIMMRGDYSKVVTNVSDFLVARRQHGMNGPVIETVFYVMPKNEHEEEKYLKQWRGVVDHARLGGRISESFAGYKMEGNAIEARTHTCINLWERMTVFWNGDVTICCEDVDGDWILGNLREKSIGDIWNCEQLLTIREIHREMQFEKFPFCLSCDM